MTREERKLRRRQIRLMTACIAIAVLWLLHLLIGTANAVYLETVAEPELPVATRVFVIIGVGWVAEGLMRIIGWLDTPRGGKRR